MAAKNSLGTLTLFQHLREKESHFPAGKSEGKSLPSRQVKETSPSKEKEAWTEWKTKKKTYSGEEKLVHNKEEKLAQNKEEKQKREEKQKKEEKQKREGPLKAELKSRKSLSLSQTKYDANTETKVKEKFDRSYSRNPFGGFYFH